MIISRDGGMGGIVAVGGGRELEEKTMVVAASAVAGEGEEGAKGKGSVLPPRRRPERVRRVQKGRWSGLPRWGSRGLEVGSPSRRGMEEENPWAVVEGYVVSRLVAQAR